MTNRTNPRGASPKPQPDGEPSLHTIDQRLTNIERVVLGLQAMMTPKWVRYAGWGTFAGACLRVLVFGAD